MPTRQLHNNKQKDSIFKNSFTPWALATFGSASIPPGHMLETRRMRMHLNTCVTGCLVSSAARSLVPRHLDREHAQQEASPRTLGGVERKPNVTMPAASKSWETEKPLQRGAERGASPLRPG